MADRGSMRGLPRAERLAALACRAMPPHPSMTPAECRVTVREHAAGTPAFQEYAAQARELGIPPKLAGALFEAVHGAGVPPPVAVGGRSPRPPTRVATDEDLRTLHPEDVLEVVHATDRATACHFARDGVNARVRPPRRFFEDPRLPGLYVTLSAEQAAGYGRCAVRFDARARELRPPFWAAPASDEGARALRALHPHSALPEVTDSLLAFRDREAVFVGRARALAARCEGDAEWGAPGAFLRRHCGDGGEGGAMKP